MTLLLTLPLTAVDGHSGLLTLTPSLPLPLALATGLTERSELSEFLPAVAVHIAGLFAALAVAVGILATVALAIRITLVAHSIAATHDHTFSTVAVADGRRTGVVGVVDDIDGATAQGGGFHD